MNLEQAQLKYFKNQEFRKKAKEKFAKKIPLILDFLKKHLKEGDYIKCKGYTGIKKVVLIQHHKVICICGYMRRGEFCPNGAGSETNLENVTEIFSENKFLKVKDLI